MFPPIPDAPESLVRLQLLGHLAASCRLALQEVEQADSVEFTVKATPHGLSVDCMVSVAGVPVTGWGQ